MADAKQTLHFVDGFWEKEIVPTLCEYIEIPNKSPLFDPKWVENGHMERVLQLALKWIEAHPLEGAKLHVGRLEGRTPLIILDVPGAIDKTVMMYGHLDKQPEMVGWRDGLGPWKAVREGDKLYGRGGADDGYALFASVCALKALREQGIPHARTVILIEFSEESGSPDLPAYVNHYADLIGDVDLVICLDSGAGNYDQLWSTTSLRGMVGGTLTVKVLTEGVHSGDASGIVPSSFRVIRQLLSRLEDPSTGEIIPAEFKAKIPEQRLQQAQVAADALGQDVYAKFPWMPGMQPMHDDLTQLVLNRTWRATLSITGQDGMPPIESAGNVLRPHTSLQISLRLPPTTQAKKAQEKFIQLMSENPPYGAKVELVCEKYANGWNAPELAPWLDTILNEVSNEFYGKPAVHMGEGGSIPFMGMLGDKFPKAQFVVTGVLGPQSNAHGPNEFLHIAYAKKLTACVTHILAQHAQR
ncbi:MAG: M20 family metallopeptidase [Acidobacteria bacterium]|nr:M20 family metallopeptidase [Acidobacteriota bacterium]MCB9398192.1 M20 family metallopeptidase [Acidobacteriota bacterium]